MYHKCIIVVSYIMSIHEPLIHHKYAVIRQKYMYSMSSHMSCADTQIRYTHNTFDTCTNAQYVIDTRIAVGRCRYTYSSIHGRYAADTQPIRRIQGGNGTERIIQCTEEGGKTRHEL